MKKTSLVLFMGSILGFVGVHAFAANVGNADSNCSHALGIIDNETKTLLGWLGAYPDSENGKCTAICDQKYPFDNGGSSDQAYDKCEDDCPGLSLETIKTKLNHYKENWINAQKEGCDLAPYEDDNTKITEMASNYTF